MPKKNVCSYAEKVELFFASSWTHVKHFFFHLLFWKWQTCLQIMKTVWQSSYLSRELSSGAEKMLNGAGEMAQCLRSTSHSFGGPKFSSQHPCQATTCNTSSIRASALFWPLQVSTLTCTDTNAHFLKEEVVYILCKKIKQRKRASPNLCII